MPAQYYYPSGGWGHNYLETQPLSTDHTPFRQEQSLPCALLVCDSMICRIFDMRARHVSLRGKTSRPNKNTDDSPAKHIQQESGSRLLSSPYRAARQKPIRCRVSNHIAIPSPRAGPDFAINTGDQPTCPVFGPTQRMSDQWSALVGTVANTDPERAKARRRLNAEVRRCDIHRISYITSEINHIRRRW